MIKNKQNCFFSETFLPFQKVAYLKQFLFSAAVFYEKGIEHFIFYKNYLYGQRERAPGQQVRPALPARQSC